MLSVAIAVSLAAIATGCASHDGSHGAASARRSTGSAVDRAFIAAMIPHHESAIEMAQIATDRGTSAFVKGLAAAIERTQAQEIARMKNIDTRLADAGATVGALGIPDHAMGMDMDVDALKGADPFDAAFLNQMLPHHEGALTMAKVELDEGADPDLKRLARSIITAQQREITAMKAHGAGASAESMDHGSGAHG